MHGISSAQEKLHLQNVEHGILSLIHIYTIFALVFPGIVTAFGTFLLKQAYRGLPKDLEEACLLYTSRCV